MLSRLGLSNFKCWSEIRDMRLAPITGLFGSNSSGKTSILQLLLMLKQTVESSDRAQILHFGDQQSLADLGSFRETVFEHRQPGELRFSLDWALGRPLEIRDPVKQRGTLFSGRSMGFDASIAESAAGRLLVDRLSYRLPDHRFTMRRKEKSETKYELEADAPDFDFVRTQGRPWPLPAPVKCYGFPDQVKAYHQNAGFLGDLQLAFEELFSRVYYLGPLREYPRRQYTWAGAEPADMGRRGERVVDALLAAQRRGATISPSRQSPPTVTSIACG